MFEALEKLQEGDMTAQDANAIAKLGDTIISSAKLEYRYLKDIHGDVSKSTFIELDEPGQRKALEGGES